jgi:hypothetical protein
MSSCGPAYSWCCQKNILAGIWMMAVMGGLGGEPQVVFGNVLQSSARVPAPQRTFSGSALSGFFLRWASVGCQHGS